MEDVLLITGGSRGIGAATARLAANKGAAIAVNYRVDAQAAEAVAEDLRKAGATALAVQGDVSDEPSVKRMFTQVEDSLGPITALVNSAGVGTASSDVADFVATDLQLLFQINVIGTMLCCREAARRMSTKRGGAGGAIVNVSSMAATIGGRPGSSHYAASKAAVDAFTVGFAREVAGAGIRVNVVRPGMTRTDMTADRLRDPDIERAFAGTIPMGRIAEADEIAQAILWLLSPEASFVAGACLDVSGGGFVIGGT